MPLIEPWVPVEPTTKRAAILGTLPFSRGLVSFTIPRSVVPDDATGILVFAWVSLSGVNPAFAFWHFASAVAGGPANWFSLAIAGDPTGQSVTCNSQEFWLPMPADRNLVVTLNLADLPSKANQGEVEIHGYYPATAERIVADI